MNQFLFDRSTGNLGSQALARLYSSQLLHALRFCPTFRFDGGEVTGGKPETEAQIWAHQSGINTLAIDKFEGRL